MPSTAQAIAAGRVHTCALTAQGGVRCWGENENGQLGDGTYLSTGVPMDVMGLTSGITAIAAGGSHTCALTATGGIKCWGTNWGGQLGDGTGTSRTTPVDVNGLTSGVAAIAAGGGHTCALTNAGGVKCWGTNGYGQLGDGTGTSRTTPVDVNGLTSGVTAIAAGWFHTCALTTAGSVKCWGNNGYGQLGDTTTNDRASPVDVVGLSSGVTAVAAGWYHTCVLTTAGSVKCWGNNWYSQLGDGTSVQRTAPVDVNGLTSSVIAVAAGGFHTCARTTTGGARCWGGNWQGQLGDGTNSTRFTPVDVSGLTSGVTAIAAGYSHTCALTAASGVTCWGNNSSGQVGDGSLGNPKTPVGIANLGNGVAAAAAGWTHICALTTAGGVKCWGNNYYGQLGDTTTNDRASPVDVNGLTSGVIAVAAGGYHTCALTAAGGVKCWGNNWYSQLGDGTSVQRTAPVDVNGLTSGVIAVTAGEYHTCALTNAGGVKCWGTNGYGQLGDGTGTSRTTPVDVNGLTSGVTAIAAGWFHTCALTTAGSVKCWGYNNEGQLGNGTWTSSPNPTPIDVLDLSSGVLAVTAGGYHTCALTNAGGVKCWGNNGYGQLGINSSGSYFTRPMNASDLTTTAAAITAGFYHTCALTNAGGVKCWGFNGYGQLGDGTNTNRSSPVDTIGLNSSTAAVRAGYMNTCAVTTAGALQCWGSNESGQMGNGSRSIYVSPIGVIGLSNTLVIGSASSPPAPLSFFANPLSPTPNSTPAPDGFHIWLALLLNGIPIETPPSTEAVQIWLPIVLKASDPVSSAIDIDFLLPPLRFSQQVVAELIAGQYYTLRLLAGVYSFLNRLL